MEAGGLTGRRVLILEDEWLVAEHLEHLVRAAGGVVVGPFAATGQALARIAAGETDVALVNVDIGQRRATWVATALRDRGIPFVLIVPYRGARYAEPALRDAPRLSRPGSVGELMQAVARAVRTAR